jgi:hypothetical protein
MPVKSACVECRKRRTKCSGQRPVCQFCSDRKLECSSDTTDGLTRTADLKKKLLEANMRLKYLVILINALRFSTDAALTMLLARLRLGDQTEDIVYLVRLEAGGISSRSR